MLHILFIYFYLNGYFVCNAYFFRKGRGGRESRVVGRLNNNTPAVPPVVKENDFFSFRKSLPIYEQREQIMKLISENQVKS